MATPQWYQTPNMVIASIKLKGIPPGKITARFGEQYCAVYMGDTVYWECHLADTIVPDKCKLSVGKVRAELKLKKANLIHWSEYEAKSPTADSLKEEAPPVADVRPSTSHPPPTSLPSSTTTASERPFVNEDLTYLNHMPHNCVDRGGDVVVVKVGVEGVEEEKCQVTFRERTLEIRFQTSDQKFLRTCSGSGPSDTFIWGIQLYDEIVPSESSFSIKPTCVELRLKKASSVRWKALERPQHSPVIMSDEEAQTIVNQALQSGSIEQRNTLAVVVGIAGSGKTWLISRLFREKPPDRYTSTGVAEQSLRGLMHHTAQSKSFERLSTEKILKIFASLLQAGLREADIASLAKKLTEEEEPEPTQDPSGTTLDPEPSDTVPSPSPSERSYASETMISYVKRVEGSKETIMIELLHMIDTGGQPEFMEIMPSLIHNSTLTLLVLNLDQSLDEQVQFAFSENGTLFKKPLPSIQTNRQVIRQLARTLQVKRPAHKGKQHFKVSAIGTHRDCVEKKGKLPETLEAMNEEVQSVFVEHELMNEIVPVNLKEPDDDDERILEELRQHISNADIGMKAEIPFSFFMFEHEAIKCVEQKKDRKVKILSFEECVQIGARVKMSREVVKAALIFFHRHNIFLYFQRILPNVVFLAPQVPLDFVNAIVALNYKVRSGAISILPPKYKRFCNEGIITEEMLCDESLQLSCKSLQLSCKSLQLSDKSQQLSDHFIPGIYEPQDAIKLFRHIYAIVPLSNKEPQGKDQQPHTSSSMSAQEEYLMMTLLDDKPENDIQKCLPSFSKVAPLVIHFSGGCVPNGCFCNTISCLISTYNWEVCRMKRIANCLAHNIVTLSGPELPVAITIVNYTRHLEIHINTDNVMKEHLSEICSIIRKTIFEAIEEKVFELMGFDDQIEPTFLCPCDPSHVATICDFVCEGSKTYYMKCSESKSSQGCLQEKHLFWFQDQVQNLDRKPNLKDLSEELVKISYKWFELGVQLKLEEGTLKTIKYNHPENAQHCLHEMLSTWLKDESRATWDTLCVALRSETVDEKRLASNLVEKYA